MSFSDFIKSAAALKVPMGLGGLAKVLTGASMSGLTDWDSAQRTLKSPGATFNLIEKLKNGQPANIVVCGDSTSVENGGTPTANSSWLYRLIAQWLAPAFPAVTFVLKTGFNVATGVYDTSTTIQTGTGAQTCTIYNASFGGTTPTYLFGGAFFYKAYKPLLTVGNADLIIFNHGFNISLAAGNRLGLAAYALAALDEIHALNPEAGIIVVQQNPRSSDSAPNSNNQVVRGIELAAKWKNADILRFYDLFVRAGIPAGWYYDSTHPSPTVATPIMAEFAWKTMFQTVGSQRCPNPPTIGRKANETLLLNHKFDTFSAGAAASWTATNCALTEDTSDYETGSRSLVMTCSSNAAAYIEQTISGNALKLLSGKFVMLGARFLVPVNSPVNMGIVGINRSGATEQRSPRIEGSAGRTMWNWKWTGFEVPEVTPGAVGTAIVVRIYAADAAGVDSSGASQTVNGVAVKVDRVVMIPGNLPFDAA